MRFSRSPILATFLLLLSLLPRGIFAADPPEDPRLKDEIFILGRESSKHLAQWNYPEAEKTILKMIEVARREGRKDSLIRAYDLLITCYNLSGDPDLALKSVEEALVLAGDASMIFRQFDLLAERGRILRGMGKVELALESFRRAQKLVPPRKDELDREVALTLFRAGYEEDAISSLEDKLAVLEEKDRDATHDYYSLLGDLNALTGNDEKAIDYYDKLRSYYKERIKSDAFSYNYAVPGMLLKVAKIYENEGKPDKAAACYAEALSDVRKMSRFNAFLNMTYFSRMLVCLYGLQMMDEAESVIGELEAYIHEHGIIPSWEIYYQIGFTCEKRNLRELARKFYGKAIESLESFARNARVDGYGAFGAESVSRRGDVEDLYERLVSLLVMLGKYPEAWDVMEKSRARGLLDILSEGNVNITRDVPPDLLFQEKRILSFIRGQYGQIDNIQARMNDIALYGIDTRYSRLEELNRDYEEIMARIRIQNPRYADLKTASPKTLGEVRERIPANAALLEYFIGKDRSYLFLLTGDKIKAIPLGVTQSTLYRKLVLARKMIFLQREGGESPEPVLKELYSLLIKPAERELQGNKLLIIVPHRWLHYMPFSLLQDGDGKYLLERFAIVNEPAASLVSLCSDRPAARNGKLVAFALGNIPMESQSLDFDSMKRFSLSPLPGTLKEVEYIAPLFDKREIFIEKSATISNLRQSAGNADCIHIATHGVMDSSCPMLSGLVMADGLLSAAEVYNIPVRCNMIVLSACETGLGKITGGDDVVGLTSSFFYAGASSMVVSFWTVSDESTAELMKAFYRNSVTMTRAEALQKAQIELIRKYPAPFYWAPFVLLGDWR